LTRPDPEKPRVCWVDGRLEPVERPALRADDSAFSEGRGCYTSARIENGRARFAERHAARLARGARQLRLGPLDEALVRRALDELAEAAFGSGSGIVRLQASRDGDGGLHLVGVPRPLGPEPAEWSAIIVQPPHDGGGLAPGLKVSSRLTMALASDAARGARADEALLVDGAGWLVEGARSNIVVVPEGAGPATPPLDRGAVAGIARDVVLERVPEIAERDVAVAELGGAHEIIALNAVRGARPITRLEDTPVGDGRAGPWAERLAAALARD